MEEMIPLSEFYKRKFPEVSEDEKINFILHSNEFEKISMKFDQIRAMLLIPQKADPAVQGQMRAINILFELANEPELIPNPENITGYTFDKSFPWFRQLHKNLMYDFYKKGETLLNDIDYPKEDEVGKYRTIEKVLANRKMPDPDSIKELLALAFQNYAKTYNVYKDDLSNPRMLEDKDWMKLERDIHKLALDICCIKPFVDGSNRIARLTENVLRLNVGLKFKIYTDKTKYLKEITENQDKYYPTS